MDQYPAIEAEGSLTSHVEGYDIVYSTRKLVAWVVSLPRVRGLIGGRFNFTARSVIAPDHTLQIDEVKLSYQCLVGLLQQRIINILHKAYNMSYNEAYIFLDSNRRYENPIIRQVIESIIKSYPRGLPVIINRNPTIVYGGVLSMKCIGISNNYSLMVPLAILRGLAADQFRSTSFY